MAAAKQVIKFLPETILPTLVITNYDQLKLLVESFENLRIVSIFFHFRGRPGRLSKCLHILMNAKDTIIVIDMVAFRDERIVWKLLKTPLFENPKLEKVFFAPEVVADYLWHQHSIRMVNFTSLTVLHDCIGKKQFPLLDSIPINKEHLKMDKSLVKFLDYYLAKTNMFHPLEMAVMLTDFAAKPPLLNECVKARKKQLALEVKYLPQLYTVMKKLAMKGIQDYMDSQLVIE